LSSLSSFLHLVVVFIHVEKFMIAAFGISIDLCRRFSYLTDVDLMHVRYNGEMHLMQESVHRFPLRKIRPMRTLNRL
jgi:hypothetical protein